MCKMSEDLYHVKIPVRDLTKEQATARTTMRAPMILPHEILNYLSETWLALKPSNSIHHKSLAVI